MQVVGQALNWTGLNYRNNSVNGCSQSDCLDAISKLGRTPLFVSE
jgi:hypothetical protein